MSFTSNPLIANLLGATGLGALASGGSDPAASAANPKMASPQQRPEYQTARPYLPRPAPAIQGVQPTFGGHPAVTPGQMDPNMDQSPNVHDLLNYYGVSAPQNIDDHLFIHDPQAFANHPLIAGMLEKGLTGLAYAHPGQNFFQSLIGGVQGMQQAHADQIQQVNNQVMAPIAQAQQIAALQHTKQQADYENAQTKYMNSRSDYYDQLPDVQAKIAQVRVDNQKSLQQLKDDAAKEREQVKIDPVLQLRQDAVAKAKKELADQKYGGDESKLTSQEMMKIATGDLSAVSTAKASGARSVKQTVGGGTINRGGARIDPQTRMRFQSNNEQIKATQQELGKIQSSNGMYLDDNGNVMDQGQLANHIAGLRQQLQTLQSDNDNITKGAGKASTSKPSTKKYSSDNPFQ